MVTARRISLAGGGRLLRLLGDDKVGNATPPPPGPGPGSTYLTGKAKGAGLAGQPVCTAAGYPDYYTALTSGELAVGAYEGFAAFDYVDEGPITVWTGGPAPLFSGLNMTPALPDTRDLYIYDGAVQPVPYSALPPSTAYRRCGSSINPTTINLSKGDAAQTPA